MTAGERARRAFGAASVPLLFAVLCAAGAWVAHLSPEFLLREMLSRFARNALLVTALLIPILAGLGLNFGIVIGAMAGQIGAILVTYWNVGGIGGFALAIAIATPLAVLFGIATGALFNASKGREMVTGFIAGYLRERALPAAVPVRGRQRDPVARGAHAAAAGLRASQHRRPARHPVRARRSDQGALSRSRARRCACRS